MPPVLRLIAAVPLSATVPSACAAPNPGTLLGRAASGDLTIGVRFDEPGLAGRTTDGRFVGFDVNVATCVAGRRLSSVPGSGAAQTVKDGFAQSVQLVDYSRSPTPASG